GDAEAKDVYERLMRTAEAPGHSCVKVGRADADPSPVETLQVLGSRIKVLEVHGDQVKIQLPDELYHPKGPIFVVDDKDVAVNRTNPMDPYIQLVRAPQSLVIEARTPIAAKDNALLCVHGPSTKLR